MYQPTNRMYAMDVLLQRFNRPCTNNRQTIYIYNTAHTKYWRVPFIFKYIFCFDVGM